MDLIDKHEFAYMSTHLNARSKVVGACLHYLILPSKKHNKTYELKFVGEFNFM
jgi:hypothetical protein